ncbi:MAG: hypothetical protein LBP62_03705 [Clostridiales bacterium]|jgi:DNA-binding CsgD family transcriptional regulator|nr:hypothetical protein [Clostridiales bacterium]
MTREQLKELGLEKDVIDKIMDIHGADVKKHKTNVNRSPTANNRFH